MTTRQQQLLEVWESYFADNEEGLITEETLRIFAREIIENFTMDEALGFFSMMRVTRTSSIDLPHIQLINPNITGKVNGENRAEFYLRDNGDFEARNPTGMRHVWRAGHFMSELMSLDQGGNLNLAGSLRINGQLIGTPTAPTPKGVSWVVKPGTPDITGNSVAIGFGSVLKSGDESNIPAATLNVLLPAAGYKQVCSIAANLTTLTWEIILGDIVQENENFIFPVVTDNYLHLTYLELSTAPVVYTNEPIKLLTAPGDDSKNGLTQKAIKDYYALKTDLPSLTPYALKTELPNLNPYALKVDLNALATAIAAVDSKAVNAQETNTTEASQITSNTNRISTLETNSATKSDLTPLALKSELTPINQAIADIQTKNTTQDNSITNNTNRLTTLESKNNLVNTRDLGTAAISDINLGYFVSKKATVTGVNEVINTTTTINGASLGLVARVVIDSKNTGDTLTGILASSGTQTVTLNGLTGQSIIVDQVGFTFTPGVRNEIEITQIDTNRFEIFINPKL